MIVFMFDDCLSNVYKHVDKYIIFSTIVPLPFCHKLNYFLFCRTFEILLIFCVNFLIKPKVQLSCFEPQNFHDSDLILK
jgi:hypothetical protein